MYGQGQQGQYSPSVTSGNPGNLSYASTMMTAGELNAGNKIERDSIPHALDEHLNILTELHKVISVLEERLALVLIPPGPNTNGAGTAPAPSHVLDRIRANSQVTAAAVQRVHDLVQRVQL